MITEADYHLVIVIMPATPVLVAAAGAFGAQPSR